MDGVWTTDAVGDFLAIGAVDRRAATRIHQSVVQFQRDGSGDIKKLQARPDEWRLRVGDWRVIFTYEGPARRVRVLRVVNRRDAYE